MQNNFKNQKKLKGGCKFLLSQIKGVQECQNDGLLPLFTKQFF